MYFQNTKKKCISYSARNLIRFSLLFLRTWMTLNSTQRPICIHQQPRHPTKNYHNLCALANRAESRVNCEGHIIARRKAAKMLIMVVIMFGIWWVAWSDCCWSLTSLEFASNQPLPFFSNSYLPLHIINTLRYTIGLPQNDITTVASLIGHWLCYANSALNPIIYNIMSGKCSSPVCS